MSEVKERSIDLATQKMLKRASEEEIMTVWDRFDLMGSGCKFGKEGICCRICSMGPCRITKKAEQGVCGASTDTIVARNLARMIAAGAAAHSDHGRDTAHALLLAAQGKAGAYGKLVNYFVCFYCYQAFLCPYSESKSPVRNNNY